MLTEYRRTYPWLLLAALALLPSCNPDKNKLLFRPEVQGSRVVNTTEAVSFSMNIVGMDMTMGYSRDASYIMTVKSIDDTGDTTLDVTYDVMRFEVNGLEGLLGGFQGMPNMPKLPGMDDPLGLKALKEALNALKGETFTVRVNRHGEVLKVTGADAIAKKVTDGLKGPARGPAAGMGEGLVKGLGDEGTLAAMKSIFLVTPDKALNAGDSWQETLERDDLAVPMQADTAITVRERSQGTLTLDLVSKYTLDLSSGPLKETFAGAKGSTSITGQGSGVLSFEEATGWLREGVTTGKVSGSLSPVEGVQFPINASFKTEVHSYPK